MCRFEKKEVVAVLGDVFPSYGQFGGSERPGKRVVDMKLTLMSMLSHISKEWSFQAG